MGVMENQRCAIMIIREMPLCKLRYNQDYTLKSMAQILFNSKCEVDRERNRKEREGGEKE